MSVAFDSSRDPTAFDLGKHIATTLTLQVWQLLLVPPGDHPRTGGVTWDIDSTPPRTFEEMDRLVANACEDPQLVIWGKTWPYGGEYIVEPSLEIRRVKQMGREVGRPLWSVELPSGKTVAIGPPHQRIDFDSIAVDAGLLRDLNDPAKLALYDVKTCTQVVDTVVGSYFTAETHLRTRGEDVAIVSGRHGRLPDRGCLRLSGLSLKRSDLVRLSGGLIAFLRNDWRYAQRLLQPIADEPHGRTSIRVDALLYLAVAADHLGQDPLPSIQRAYELNPYERVVVQYLCMGHLWALGREARGSQGGTGLSPHVVALQQILRTHAPVLPESGDWIESVRQIANTAQPATAR